jgi:hypothetical protein
MIVIFVWLILIALLALALLPLGFALWRHGWPRRARPSSPLPSSSVPEIPVLLIHEHPGTEGTRNVGRVTQDCGHSTRKTI